MPCLQKIRDLVKRIIIYQQSAEKPLLGFDIMRHLAKILRLTGSVWGGGLTVRIYLGDGRFHSGNLAFARMVKPEESKDPPQISEKISDGPVNYVEKTFYEAVSSVDASSAASSSVLSASDVSSAAIFNSFFSFCIGLQVNCNAFFKHFLNIDIDVFIVNLLNGDILTGGLALGFLGGARHVNRH